MNTLPPLTEEDILWLQLHLAEGDDLYGRVESLDPFLIAREHFTAGDETVFGHFARPHRSQDGRWWLVRGLLASDDGPSLVRLLAVQPWPWEPHRHEREVTSSLLREIRVAELRNAAIASITTQARVAAKLPPPFTATPTQEVAAERARPAQRGRRPLYGDDHYRALALRYVELGESGDRQVRRTLAREQRVDEERIREWLRQARRRGFLAPTTRGRANFELGTRFLTERKED